MASCRLSLVAASGGYSSLQCSGFSLQWLPLCRAQALGTQASVVLVPGLLAAPWHVEIPGPGIEPASPALQGEFLSIGPPGKPLLRHLRHCQVSSIAGLFTERWGTAVFRIDSHYPHNTTYLRQQSGTQELCDERLSWLWVGFLNEPPMVSLRGSGYALKCPIWKFWE